MRRSLALVGALLLGGCGGQGAPGKQALQQEAGGLQSLAAEGAILASDASRGRSTSTFVRVHAAELTKAARSSASVVAKGHTADARALTHVARRTVVALDRLSHSDSNRAQQRRLAARLERAAKDAERLASSP